MPQGAIGLLVTVGTAIYQSEQSRKQQSKAKDEARKQAGNFRRDQLQAGEYWEELNLEQMELQSQMSQITLLSDILTNQRRDEPQIMTLPAAKTYTVTQRINMALDDYIKGRR